MVKMLNTWSINNCYILNKLFNLNLFFYIPAFQLLSYKIRNSYRIYILYSCGPQLGIDIKMKTFCPKHIMAVKFQTSFVGSQFSAIRYVTFVSQYFPSPLRSLHYLFNYISTYVVITLKSSVFELILSNEYDEWYK